MALSPDVQARIESLIHQNKIVVFMKGNKLMPQCGFSNNVVQILNALGATYETFDILQDYEIRQGIKEYSNWPTIPQVYINGEFLGGSDIMIELYQSGELAEKVALALAS
ncbi:MAG: Grx4 family monothiol glutaredoxin [Gloeomargaritaceae cyanobacterium C42_A2020_066]|nr:Grx4 family monothiol glutaredoxin [Gloeomargaritaceae cyanobacterium C42_A2020_066]